MENTIDLFVYAPEAAREAIGPVGMATLDHLAKDNGDVPRWVTGGFLVRCLMANWLRSRGAHEAADSLLRQGVTERPWCDIDVLVEADDKGFSEDIGSGAPWAAFDKEIWSNPETPPYARYQFVSGRKIDLVDTIVVKAGLHDFPLSVTRFDFDANVVAYSLVTGHLFSARPVARFGASLEVLRPTTFSRIDKYMAMGFRQVAGLWGMSRVLDEDDDRDLRLGKNLPYKNVDLVSGSDACVCIGQTDPEVVDEANAKEGFGDEPTDLTGRAAWAADDTF